MVQIPQRSTTPELLKIADGTELAEGECAIVYQVLRAYEADKLTTARLINGVPFDGTQDITILENVDNTSDMDKPVSTKQKWYIDTQDEALRKALQTNIDAEAAARILADTVLQAAIDAIGTGTTADVTALQASIATETAARIAADTTLQSNINGKAPIDHAVANTTYGAASDANYGHVQLSTAAPSAPGTAAVGTSARAARQDHTHALQTTLGGYTAAQLIANAQAGISAGNTVAVLTGTITQTLATAGGTAFTAPLPSGFTEAQCHFIWTPRSVSGSYAEFREGNNYRSRTIYAYVGEGAPGFSVKGDAEYFAIGIK